MNLSLYNTLTKKIQTFKPLSEQLVKMYVCGPTVYDHPHIGNARSVVVYDLLFRLLRQLYGDEHVCYVRNITDIDDKIIKRAAEKGVSIVELTQTTTEYFHSDMKFLQCLSPSVEPKATEHMNEMISMITSLVESGHAYVKDGHVFFSVEKAKDYTKLSGRTMDELFDSVRIENSDSKTDNADFVLWKPGLETDPESANFRSPFGEGRPGWHIECSAMSHKYLGENFDIHGGGVDLIFPHHTNEVAQSCSAFPGSKFANYWVHNGFLTVNRQKMSKSLGNFVTVHDLRQQNIEGIALRLLLLSTHYRKPLDYNDKALDDANKILEYWFRVIEDIEDTSHELLDAEFLQALLDDLNISVAIRRLNELAKHANSTDNSEKKQKLATTLKSAISFLGLLPPDLKKWKQNKFNSKERKKIDQLVAERSKLKLEKKWQEADKIRDFLMKKGIEIEDKPGGVSVWKKKLSAQ